MRQTNPESNSPYPKASARFGRRDFLTLSGLAALGLLAGQGRARPVIDERRRASREPSGNSDVISLFLCGDVMTGRGIDQVLPHPGDPLLCESYITSALGYVELAERVNGRIPKPVDFPYIWGEALVEFERRRPDARIINLETSVTKSGDCFPKGINYRMNPENVRCLTAAKIDCCALANNHVLDWGDCGLAETLETLKKANVKTAGAGRDLERAAAPAIIEVAGKGRVVVFSMATETSGVPSDWAASEDKPGVNMLADLSHRTAASIAKVVRRVKRPGDIVVASIHWGGNWGYRIPRRQTRFARRLIDKSGIDVVHGHSSHHPKAIEIHNGKPILYGCGDFLNDYEGIGGYEEFRDDLALMYFPSIAPSSGKLVAFTMTPLRIKNFRLNRAAEEDCRWLRDVLNRESGKFGTRVELQENNTLVIR